MLLLPLPLLDGERVNGRKDAANIANSSQKDHYYAFARNALQCICIVLSKQFCLFVWSSRLLQCRAHDDVRFNESQMKIFVHNFVRFSGRSWNFLSPLAIHILWAPRSVAAIFVRALFFHDLRPTFPIHFFYLLIDRTFAMCSHRSIAS